MHELSLVTAILNKAETVIAEQRATGLVAVHLRRGPLSCANPDSLHFCFPLAIQGTPLEGARLVIHDEPLELLCTRCEQITKTPQTTLKCGYCASEEVEVLSGKDLIIDSLELY